MIPSILILSYFHGAPGKDKWNRIERIGIPLNIVISLIVMAVTFYPKDLGAITKTVSYEHMCSSSCQAGCDKYGSLEERVIPKVVAMAYYPDGTPKRTVGYWYPDIKAVWTNEMESGKFIHRSVKAIHAKTDKQFTATL